MSSVPPYKYSIRCQNGPEQEFGTEDRIERIQRVTSKNSSRPRGVEPGLTVSEENSACSE
jgi:hypothetical protein